MRIVCGGPLPIGSLHQDIVWIGHEKRNVPLRIFPNNYRWSVNRHILELALLVFFVETIKFWR